MLIQPRGATIKEPLSRRRALIGLTLALGISTTTLMTIYNRLLPTAEGLVGHDFSYFLPYLLTGLQWIHLNGWSTIPYFTPNFCGGMPWLANPQSVFYSVPQALSLLMDFVTAIKLTAIIFATIGAIATYALLRQCFGTSWQAATLGCVLFHLNSFLIFRIAIGHLTYHVFGLVPLLGWSVLYLPQGSAERTSRSWALIACGIVTTGCLLALMVYGGGTNYVIPGVLSVAAIILLRQASTGWCWAPWITLGGGCFWSVSLCALKLIPTFLLASTYPRSYLENQLFLNPLKFVYYLLRSLFVPELLPYLMKMGRQDGWPLGLHELEFGISVVPALLIVAALVSFGMRMTRPPFKHPLILLMLVLIVSIPILLTVGSDAWGKLLVRIPIINNNTMLTRWYSIYILLVIVLAALSFDRIFRQSLVRDLILIVCVILSSVQVLGRDLTYYTTSVVFPLYNPAPIEAEARRISSGGLPRPITEVGPPDVAHASTGDVTGIFSRSDALLWGRSAAPCYEALFGYSLEMFPGRELRTGPIFDQVAGNSINLIDPRCYLTSTERSCSPGSLFRPEDLSDALAFASHQPLRWEKPAWQEVAEAATLTSLILSFGVLLAFVGVGLFMSLQQCKETH